MDKAKEALAPKEGETYGVYDHIFNMVSTALEKNPQNILQAVQKLPEFSKHVKGHRFDAERGIIRPPAACSDDRDVKRAREERALFDNPEPKVITEVSRPTPFTTVTTTTTEPVGLKTAYRPIAEDQRYHRIAGVGMPKREYFLLDQAIAKLALEKDLKDVQFVGKIFGTQSNYIVVRSRRYFEDPETKVYKERYEMPKAPRKGVDVPIQIEPSGIGLNRVSFWVCKYAGAEWTCLPDVTPQQINAARKIKKYFTGDLDAPVQSYPPFPGNEMNYLRAQLARITSATDIQPEGQVEVFADEDEDAGDDDEENPNALKEEKYKPLVTEPKPVAIEEGIESMASTEKWQHTNMFIYKTGRGTMLPPAPEKEDDDEPPADDEEEEGEKEPEEEKKELLQPIKEDARYAVIKIPAEPKEGEDGEGEGDADAEKEDEDADGEDDGEDNPRRMVLQSWTGNTTNGFYKKHGVVVIRSLRWPGATTWLASGQVSGSVYLGDGLKSTDNAFSPPIPPPVQKEVQDMQEQADPTSMTEKLVLRGEEPKADDSEDEKEEEEQEADE